MAATMQAEAAEARAEADKAAEWREQMQAGQLLLIRYAERSMIAAEAAAGAVVALEARAAAFGPGAALGALFRGRGRPEAGPGTTGQQ